MKIRNLRNPSKNTIKRLRKANKNPSEEIKFHLFCMSKGKIYIKSNLKYTKAMTQRILEKLLTFKAINEKPLQEHY
jgi:intein-encoded DNA endonuclease-like protein